MPDALAGDPLAPYVAPTHLRWLGERTSERWRIVDGTLLFLDVSGFTPLTERLATRGKAGGEELTDHLNTVFTTLIDSAAALGGEVLKFGGDALFLLFREEGHPQRARAAAWDMQMNMRPFKRLRTSVGTVPLQASAGLASGPVHMFLAGGSFDELVIAGPTVTACLNHEKEAEATQILCEEGLLTVRPDVEPRPLTPAPALDARLGLPAILHDELAHAPHGEHRLAVVSFVQFRGVDELLDAEGPEAASQELDSLLADVQAACVRHGVTFICTDADLAAGKVMLCAGSPRASDDDADRMLHATREIVSVPRRLRVRAGVNRGRIFAVHLGAPVRRTYTTMGDATNLAARVMGKAPDGAVLATTATLGHIHAAFALDPLEPFMVKGKSQPVQAALVGEPGARATGVRADAAVPPGREAEAELLREAIGSGRDVRVSGPAGIGKSRLVSLALAIAEADEIPTVVVEGGAYGAHAPYLAVRAPLRAMLGIEESDDAAAQLLAAAAEHVPEADAWAGLLGPLLGLDLPLSERAARLDAESARRRRHLAAEALVAGLLAQRRALVVVEDAHWLDAASADLLSALAASPELEERVAFVVSERDGVAGARIELPEGSAALALAGLPDPVARALVLELAGGDVPPDAVDTIVERAGGNPLVLGELVDAVRAGGDLDSLPDSVEALLAAAIDRLPPSDRGALRQAAVLGARFPRSALGGLLDLGEQELDDVLARLAGFLAPIGREVRFHQTLQRSVAYEALPFRRRRDLHGRAMDLVAAGAPEEIELLALHAHHAGRVAEAWTHARAAAERALRRGAPGEALTLFGWAVSAGRALPAPPRELAAVLEAQGDAAELAGRTDASAAAYAEGRRLLREDPLAVADLCRKQARACERAGRYSQALAWATRGRRALESAPAVAAAEAVAGRLDTTYGTARVRQGRVREGHDHLARAVERLERARDAGSLARALYMLAFATEELGDIETSSTLAGRAAELFVRAGDQAGAAAAYNNLGITAYLEGDWVTAGTRFEESLRMRREVGDVANAAENEINLGTLRAEQGRWDEAVALARSASGLLRGARRLDGLGMALATLGQSLARRGDTAAAAEALAEARAVLEEIGAAPLVLEVAVCEAECAVLDGDAARAQEIAERALRDAAGESGAYLLAPLHRVIGWAWALREDPDAAFASFDAAARAAREAGLPYQEALALHASAALRRRLGSPDLDAEADVEARLRPLGVVAVAEPPAATALSAA